MTKDLQKTTTKNVSDQPTFYWLDYDTPFIRI
jgi:hypothetical protein